MNRVESDPSPPGSLPPERLPNSLHTLINHEDSKTFSFSQLLGDCQTLYLICQPISFMGATVCFSPSKFVCYTTLNACSALFRVLIQFASAIEKNIFLIAKILL